MSESWRCTDPACQLDCCPRCGGVRRPGWGWRSEPPVKLSRNDEHLIDSLELAVPMWMDLLDMMGVTERERHIWWWTQTAIDPIAYRADNLMYGHERKPTRAARAEIAETFNYLASALAALAYSPGGVSFAGRHWCTTTEEAA